jgi:hypothetical protein
MDIFASYQATSRALNRTKFSAFEGRSTRYCKKFCTYNIFHRDTVESKFSMPCSVRNEPEKEEQIKIEFSLTSQIIEP